MELLFTQCWFNYLVNQLKAAHLTFCMENLLVGHRNNYGHYFYFIFYKKEVVSF
jgi:hypothetical protein